LFPQEDGILFCNDVCSIMEVLGHEYNPSRWCLLIDSSKVSLKVVVIHNRMFSLHSYSLCSQHEGNLRKHESTVGKV
jgi:hypothetical protein